MSKLAQAIEKAKQKRGDVPSPESLGGSAPNYSQTKRVNLDVNLLERNHIFVDVSKSHVVDYYSMLRTQLMQRCRVRGWNTIMVTSVVEGEGKSTVAINLALTMARDAQQTAFLVEANLRNPTLARLMGMDGSRGLTDHLVDDVPIPQLMINPGIKKLTVLPAGRATRSSTDILDSPKVESFVRDVKTRYPDRFVIFDCPHLKDMPDALVFSSYVDCIILVIKAGSTRKRDITNALDMLKNKNVIGLVLNNYVEN